MSEMKLSGVRVIRGSIKYSPFGQQELLFIYRNQQPIFLQRTNTTPITDNFESVSESVVRIARRVITRFETLRGYGDFREK